MKDKLIQRFKNQRKKKYITKTYTQKYAFVGLGGHSIANLYPILDYFRVDLKYIVTKSTENSELIDNNFAHTTGTNDLDKVLNDKEICGVFISSSPASHSRLIKKCLQAGKNVFVEKPPCLSTSDLEDLVSVSQTTGGHCLVGMQKQYSPQYLELKKQLKKGATTYNYRYLTGSYPEGDAFYDLFIHPLSLIFYLFGDVATINILQTGSESNKTVFLQLKHNSGTVGNIELSTDYSWQNPLEQMTVNTEKGIFETENMSILKFSPKAGSILGVPKEKIFKSSYTTIVLNRRLDFVPTLENNQLYSAGYFSEIETFLNLSEKKLTKNNSTLESCIKVYELIDKIKKTN